MNPKVTILLNKTSTKVGDSCPTATKDIEENIKNRDINKLKIILANEATAMLHEA